MLNLACFASREERQREMHADRLIPEPSASITHGITIRVPREEVWPWLVQMGAGRAGWYSWDFIDNGGAKSAKSILAKYQSVEIGQVFPAIPGAEDAFVLQAMAPREFLVLTVPSSSGGHVVSWEFLLQRCANNSTRLLVRARIAENWLADRGRESNPKTGPILIERVYWLLSIIPRWIMVPIARIGHRIMQTRMLRRIKRRAESLHALFGIGHIGH